MPRAIINGNTIDHRHALNVVNVQAYEVDRISLFDAGAPQVWDLGLPTTGHSWVISSASISFDVLPTIAGTYFIDSLVGANIWWVAFIGQAPAALAIEPGNPATYHFNFNPALKFPVDEDVAINWLPGTPQLTGWMTLGCWEEDDICY